MFKKSSLGSSKNFPGGRWEVSGGAFQEFRQLIAEEERTKPFAVDHTAPCPKVDGDGAVCTCPPEPEHDHDIAAAEGEGMPPLKNNCKACFPPVPNKTNPPVVG